MKLIFFLVFPFLVFASDSVWNESFPIPENGISNPYGLNNEELYLYKKEGLKHALTYPISVSGLLLPLEAIQNGFNAEDNNPIKKIFLKILNDFSGINEFNDIGNWLGLHDYPKEELKGAYWVPKPTDYPSPTFHMGVSILNWKDGTKAFTYSCATCHAANLFGKKVMGLTNRFPRANEFFRLGKLALNQSDSFFFGKLTNASPEELYLFKRAQHNIAFVESVKPLQLGMDTSLAHVALSLSHRAQDSYASKTRKNRVFPRREVLRYTPADSKPAVWWNVKFKNKWLLDGSVVSGNPILTNILWNEIGRGTDLYQLEQWFEDNEKIIQELTTAVYNAEAPRITDFVDSSYFKLDRLKNGQRVYKQACQKCHGIYEKKWDLLNASQWSWKEQLENSKVILEEDTIVKNVGTDEYRYKAMSSLLQLNDLSISKKYGIKIKLQEGYVPPPLIGIWARWPYFHNNSIANLCQLLEGIENRVKKYWAGEANSFQKDFDFECNGYPLSNKTPKEWKRDKKYLYDTRRAGMSNKGHTKMLFDKATAKERFSKQEKLDLIHFLQTL